MLQFPRCMQSPIVKLFNEDPTNLNTPRSFTTISLLLTLDKPEDENLQLPSAFTPWSYLPGHNSSANLVPAEQAGYFCTVPHRAIEVTAGCWSGQYCTGLCLDWTDCSQHSQHWTDWPKMVKTKKPIFISTTIPVLSLQICSIITHQNDREMIYLIMYYSCKVIQKLHHCSTGQQRSMACR